MTRAGLRAPLPWGLIGGEPAGDGAAIRAVTGREEELLAESLGESTAVTVTAILARCVLSLGNVATSADAVRQLSVGDREALLLHLRRATLGDQIDCVAMCPDPGCGERLDLTLSVGSLLVEPVADAAAWYEETFATAGGEAAVRFRVPTGADQEAIADIASTDAVAAARELLARCVASAPGSGGDSMELPDDVADAVAVRMAELDPQAEIRLRFDCAACGRPVDVLFDTASFFFAEIGATAERLYDEIHAIAWHYHWSEDAILDLPRNRRRRYLDLISASLGARQARGVA
jgi:hypothetical protein